MSTKKISTYKIKKILKYFIEDYTSSQVSEIMKLNRKTTDRYFSIFRKIIFNYIESRIKYYKLNCKFCLGHTKTDSKNQLSYKIYKINNQLLCRQLYSQPQCKRVFKHNQISEYFYLFHYKRLAKFYGSTESGHYNQLVESTFRYNYTDDEMFNIIWKLFLKGNYKD